MSSTREVKQRIKNIESVEQLIRAIHMVASTQLRRANRQLHGVLPLQEALQRKIDELASNEDVRDFPYYACRPVQKSLYVVFSGDRGLAGSYNNKVQKFALEQMADRNEAIIVIGSYGHRFFQKNNKNIIRSIVDVADAKIYYGSQHIADLLLESFLTGKSDEVFLVYTEFKNVLSSQPKIERILPLPLTEKKTGFEKFEPSLAVYLDSLVPFYLHMCIFKAFSEAHTSEHAARMLAMDTAGNNATELVEKLQRKLNRQRQQEITQELSEIVGQQQ